MPRYAPCLLTAGLVLVGCEKSDPHVELFREQDASRREVIKVLRTVTDEASMNAARKELEALHDRFREIDVRVRGMLKPSRETVARLEKELPAMQEGLNEQRREVARIMQLPGGKEFLLDLKDIGSGP